MIFSNLPQGERVKQILQADGWKVAFKNYEGWNPGDPDPTDMDVLEIVPVVFWALTLDEAGINHVYPVVAGADEMFFADLDATFFRLIPPSGQALQDTRHDALGIARALIEKKSQKAGKETS